MIKTRKELLEEIHNDLNKSILNSESVFEALKDFADEAVIVGGHPYDRVRKMTKKEIIEAHQKSIEDNKSKLKIIESMIAKEGGENP